MALRAKLVLALCCVFAAVVVADNTVALTVAYCPDEFTGAGAVIHVNPTDGSWKIVNQFEWPAEVYGCPALYDPTVTVDCKGKKLFLNFADLDALIITIDLDKGKVLQSKTPDRWQIPMFPGMTNMEYIPNKFLGGELKGLSPHVEEKGSLCDDGCFRYGELDPNTGKFKNHTHVLFKAAMTDSHFYDKKTDTYYVQASYDLRPEPCAPSRSDMCLLSLDGTSGELQSSTWTNYTVYKYGRQADADGTLLAFMEGFEDQCQHPYGDFLFGDINLEDSSAVLRACVPRNLTIQEEEWLSSFSQDGSMFVTGSRWGGNTQFLVLDTTSGEVLLDSHLPGIAAALKAMDKLFFVWSVDFIDTA